MQSSDFGAFVRRVRRRAGWSQALLGRAAGIPQSHVAKIERGADVRASTLLRVLDALGHDLHLRANARGLFLNPPEQSRIAAARAYGIDLGQLHAAFAMSPPERLDAAARNATGLTELLT